MTSRRLRVLLDYFPPHRRLYDIGTDHAKLPIAAWQEGLIDDCLAVDNKKGPLVQARANLALHPEAPIRTALADGLQALEATHDLIVFAGVGGQTIHDVIATGALKHVKRLILQPTAHAHRVRALCDIIDWHIVEETVVDAGDRFYPTIVMEPGRGRLTEQEKRFGPTLLKTRETAFLRMLRTERTHLKKLLTQLPDTVDTNELTRELNAIEEVLSDDTR